MINRSSETRDLVGLGSTTLQVADNERSTLDRDNIDQRHMLQAKSLVRTPTVVHEPVGITLAAATTPVVSMMSMEILYSDWRFQCPFHCLYIKTFNHICRFNSAYSIQRL